MGTISSTSEELLPIPVTAIAELEERLGVSLEGWADHPPRYVSPSPESQVEGAWFDVDAVAHVVQVLRLLPHTKGRWARKAFEPAPWQIVWILAPVFGWKNPDKTRIVRELWDEVARKNGKTSLSARLAVYGLTADGEEGAEVYAAAHVEKQARQVFDEAANVTRRSPVIGPRVRSGEVSVQHSVILVKKTASVFRVLSRDAEAAHGLNVHFGIVDEIHVHKTRKLIDAIATGTGAREQPLMIYITTADEGDDSSIYAEKHGYAVRLSEGAIIDPTTYVVIWAAEREDDPYVEETWIKANPNYPESPTKSYLERESRKAKNTPSLLPTFLRLHLNVRMAEESHRVDWDWMASAGSMIDEAKLAGLACWGGLVTRTAQDLTAIAWTFQSPEVSGEWWTIWRHFMPEEMFGRLVERTNGAAETWKREGRVRFTEGNSIDLNAHLEQIRRDSDRFNVHELAYASTGAIGIVSTLFDEQRFPLVPIHANTPGTALVDWEALVRSQRYRHGADPVMAWQMNNLVLRSTAADITRIDPKGSHDVVPAVVAAEIALRRALLETMPETSVYEDHGIQFLG